MSRLRVLVAEDHALVRAGIRALIGSGDEFEVCGECATYSELIEAVRADPPDVVLTDIKMPPSGTDEGIRAAVELSHSHPGIGVVVLSQYVEAAYALAMIENGSKARGYLVKDHVSDAGHLFAALRAVAAGDSYIDPLVVDAMFAAKHARSDSALAKLTAREREILAEVASGKSNAAVGAALFIGERAWRSTSTPFSPNSGCPTMLRPTAVSRLFSST